MEEEVDDEVDEDVCCAVALTLRLTPPPLAVLPSLDNEGGNKVDSTVQELLRIHIHTHR